MLLGWFAYVSIALKVVCGILSGEEVVGFVGLLETRITELVKREADKNCIIECLTKTMLNKTNRKETLQRWDGSSNQNIRFTEMFVCHFVNI